MLRIPLFLCALLSAFSPLPAQQPPAAPPPAAQPQPAQPQPAQAARPAEQDAFTIGITGFYATPKDFGIGKGDEATSERPGDLRLNHRDKPLIGGAMKIPVKEHELRLSYFQGVNSGNTTAFKDINLFGGEYSAGDYLATRYKLQNAKVSFEYVSWPYPLEDRKFRIKTLWQVQYVNVRSSVNAPLKPVEEGAGTSVEDSRWFIYPSLGLGIEHRTSRYFRFEVQGSGFYLPGKPNVWDAHAAAILPLGKVELTIGAKGFHFKTSENAEHFFKGTLLGAFAGIAWRFE